MLTIDIWTEGATALLMNRATEEALLGRTRSNTAGEITDPRDIAEKGVYRFPTRQLAVPGAAFARMVREAGGAHKVKGSRKSLKFMVPAAMVVLDELCGLCLKDRKTPPLVDFEIDARPVTIPTTKGRIMRYLARANEWSCRVRIQLNETIISESMVRQLFVEGLQQIGIGDYRPEKGGPFGTSQLVGWDVISDAKAKTGAQVRNGASVTIS
jgi:hypothetical protein